jgi:hypothetical protein
MGISVSLCVVLTGYKLLNPVRNSYRRKRDRRNVLMEKLVQYIAEALVDHPEQVQVKSIMGENSIIIELKVAPDDVGKVIGKGGQTAKAIRKILSAAATKLKKKSLLQILE